jgi:hypothetical protein
MNTRHFWILGTAIIIGCLVLGLCLSGRSGADEKAEKKPEPAPVGRYQMVLGKDGEIEVIDTTTGQVWSWSPVGNAWSDLKSPARK